MMTWRTTGILGTILFLAFVLSIQGADALPPYVRDGAPTEVTFDEDETFSGLNLYEVFADDDPEDAHLDLAYHQVDDLEISIDQSTGQIIISAPKSYHGEVDVVFEAIDSNGSFVLHEITIVILPVNDPPVIRKYIPLQEMDEEDTFSIDLENYQGGPVFEDIEGGGLTYKFDNDGDIIASISGSVITFTAATDFVGFFSDLVIWAEDDLGARSEIMRLFFTVRGDCGGMPMVTWFEPKSTKVTIKEGMMTSFSILDVSEYDLVEWIFTWHINGEEVVDHGSPVLSYPDFVTIDEAFQTSGIFNITVDLRWWNDPFVRAYDSPKWTLTVLDVNRLPEVKMLTLDQKVSYGNDLNLKVRGFDPDGDDLNYRWLHSRDMVRTRVVGTGDKLVLKMDLPPGKHYFRCEVSDGKNTTASEWVTFTIEPGETPSPLGFVVMVVVLFTSILLGLVSRSRLGHSKAY